jgi:hypothetical protein
LSCVCSLAHDKHFFPTGRYLRYLVRCLCRALGQGARQRHSQRMTKIYVCRVFPSGARQTYILRTANIYLCRVFPYGPGQSIFKKFDFCTSFDFSTSRTLFCTQYFKFIHVSINLLCLTIVCHLKNLCRIYQI